MKRDLIIAVVALVFVAIMATRCTFDNLNKQAQAVSPTPKATITQKPKVVEPNNDDPVDAPQKATPKPSKPRPTYEPPKSANPVFVDVQWL